MTHAKARTDNKGSLIALESMTTEQLQATAEEYKLSPEGTPAELQARIREYEFKTGKTEQPYHFRDDNDMQPSQHQTLPQRTYPAQEDPHGTPVVKSTQKAK